MNTTKLDIFMQSYERHLGIAVIEHPDEYAYPRSEVPAVVARMRVAIERGPRPGFHSINKDSRAIKATCRELGIKHTYTAMNAFIETGTGSARTF